MVRSWTRSMLVHSRTQISSHLAPLLGGVGNGRILQSLMILQGGQRRDLPANQYARRVKIMAMAIPLQAPVGSLHSHRTPMKIEAISTPGTALNNLLKVPGTDHRLHHRGLMVILHTQPVVRSLRRQGNRGFNRIRYSHRVRIRLRRDK